MTPRQRSVPKKLPALYDGEGHCIVDQEHADQQGEQAQGSQVQAEGSRHFFECPAALRFRAQLDAGRQQAADLRLVAEVAFGDDQVDVIEPPELAGYFLGGGDIRQDHPLQRAAQQATFRRICIAWLDQPGDECQAGMPAAFNFYPAAGFGGLRVHLPGRTWLELVAPGKVLREQDRAGLS